MKKVYMLLLVFSFPLLLSAQQLQFVSKWKAGDSFKYLYFSNKYNVLDSTYKKNNDTVLVLFKVLKASQKGCELEMRYNYSKRASGISLPQGLKRVVAELKQEPMVLVLDSSGKYLSIKNWQDLKKQTLAKLEEGKKIAVAAEKESWEYWKTKVQTQEQIERFFISDVEFFFMLYGSSLKNNSSIDYNDVMLSPYDDESLAAITQLVTIQDSSNAKNVIVKLYTVPDEEMESEKLTQYRSMVKEQEDITDNTEEDLFDLQDYYEFVNNKETGVNQKAIYLRYLKTGNKELVEEYLFVLTK